MNGTNLFSGTFSPLVSNSLPQTTTQNSLGFTTNLAQFSSGAGSMATTQTTTPPTAYSSEAELIDLDGDGHISLAEYANASANTEPSIGLDLGLIHGQLNQLRTLFKVNIGVGGFDLSTSVDELRGFLDYREAKARGHHYPPTQYHGGYSPAIYQNGFVNAAVIYIPVNINPSANFASPTANFATQNFGSQMQYLPNYGTGSNVNYVPTSSYQIGDAFGAILPRVSNFVAPGVMNNTTAPGYSLGMGSYSPVMNFSSSAPLANFSSLGNTNYTTQNFGTSSYGTGTGAPQNTLTDFGKIQQAMQYYVHADSNRDGFVSKQEAQTYAADNTGSTQSYGYTPPTSGFTNVDTNGNGKIDLFEFVQNTGNLGAPQPVQFPYYTTPMGGSDDGNGNGSDHPPLTLADIDTDGNGKIDLYDLTRNQGNLKLYLTDTDFQQDTQTLYDYIYRVGGPDSYISMEDMQHELDHINTGTGHGDDYYGTPGYGGSNNGGYYGMPGYSGSNGGYYGTPGYGGSMPNYSGMNFDYLNAASNGQNLFSSIFLGQPVVYHKYW
jgi:hypothetical protein